MAITNSISYNTNIVGWGGCHDWNKDYRSNYRNYQSRRVCQFILVAKKLKIKSPSLYNRISNLEDLKNKISLYAWKQLEEKMFLSIIEESGYEAIKSMAYAFYDYATENKGIFEAMLWYNKYMIEEGNQVTHNTFDILFKILRKLNLSDETINHFIRTLRGFLEGYVLLVNHQAFGHPLSIQKSFDFSLNILINGVKNMEGK